MKHCIIFLLPILFTYSCTKTNPEFEDGVRLEVVNETNLDFDTIRFNVGAHYEEPITLIFTDVDNQRTSNPVYLESLDIMYYEGDSEFIYFANYFYGVAGSNKLYETGFGFCGTGLIFDTVEEGSFRAIITGVDEENKRMFISQRRDLD